jgi:hypothetical protein
MQFNIRNKMFCALSFDIVIGFLVNFQHSYLFVHHCYRLLNARLVLTV